jgi:hypothetical protein
VAAPGVSRWSKSLCMYMSCAGALRASHSLRSSIRRGSNSLTVTAVVVCLEVTVKLPEGLCKVPRNAFTSAVMSCVVIPAMSVTRSQHVHVHRCQHAQSLCWGVPHTVCTAGSCSMHGNRQLRATTWTRCMICGFLMRLDRDTAVLWTQPDSAPCFVLTCTSLYATDAMYSPAPLPSPRLISESLSLSLVRVSGTHLAG